MQILKSFSKDITNSRFKLKILHQRPLLPQQVSSSSGRQWGSCAPSSPARPPPRCRAPWGCWSAAWAASCPTWSCSLAATSSTRQACQSQSQEYGLMRDAEYTNVKSVTEILRCDAQWSVSSRLRTQTQDIKEWGVLAQQFPGERSGEIPPSGLVSGVSPQLALNTKTSSGPRMQCTSLVSVSNRTDRAFQAITDLFFRLGLRLKERSRWIKYYFNQRYVEAWMLHYKIY